MQRILYFFSFPLLLFFLLLANTTSAEGTAFRTHSISPQINYPKTIYAADIDGDSDMDLLVASEHDNKISWFENADGKGNYSAAQVITTKAERAMAVHAADIDGDGDLDVLSASYLDNKIAWYENIDGLGKFGEQKIISFVATSAWMVSSGDLDNDGDIDVLSTEYTGDKVSWYENIDGQGHFGPKKHIEVGLDGSSDVFVADLDADNDLDVLVTTVMSGEIIWYENLDSQGTFGEPQIIDSKALGAQSIRAVDLDGDNDLDILSSAAWSREVRWYQNLDGQGNFSSGQLIAETKWLPRFVYPADFDGDSDMDILVGTMHDAMWFKNTNGQGHFSNIPIPVTEAWICMKCSTISVAAADIDNDGDIDVGITLDLEHKVAWYENTDTQGTFGASHVITERDGDWAAAAFVADIDSDNAKDVVATFSNTNTIVWYKFFPNENRFGLGSIISTSIDKPYSLFSADLDADNDYDIVVSDTGTTQSQVFWFKNTDGLGNFASPALVTDTLVGFQTVYVADINKDNHADIIIASQGNNKIAWYENTDGQGNFSIEHVITTNVLEPRDVIAVDLDKDGDLDVLSASRIDNKIAWYENTDGSGTFGLQKIISNNANMAETIDAADIDGDGDIDVVSGSVFESVVAWHANISGQGTFAPAQIISTSATGIADVVAADFDNDSDVDIAYTARSKNQIIWYQNTDGLGSFSKQEPLTSYAKFATALWATDMDGDNDVDLVATSAEDHTVWWFENYRSKCISPNPCEHLGYCIDSSQDYTCQCRSGYDGLHCETNIDDCIENPCQNDGICIDGKNQATCECTFGFSGSFCEYLIGDCSLQTCQNDSTCVDHEQGYTCSCLSGSAGHYCEIILVDECQTDSDNCDENATCLDTQASFECHCKTGYSGNGVECTSTSDDNNNKGCACTHTPTSTMIGWLGLCCVLFLRHFRKQRKPI